jgi:hypothetical protein
MGFLDDINNDLRLDALEHVAVGIDAGLKSIEDEMDRTEYDVDCREQADLLLGLGLVAFQTYAVATIESLRQRIVTRGKADPGEHFRELCYSEDYELTGPQIRGKITSMQLIHSAANYFKHHDGWPKKWPSKNHNVKMLAVAGITQGTELPCIKAVEQLCGKCWRIFGLHPIVQRWRVRIVSKFQ